MGCCCSRTPVENIDNQPNNPKATSTTSQIIDNDPNNNNNLIIADEDNPEANPQFDSDPTKKNAETDNDEKYRSDDSTISESNNTSNIDFDSRLDIQSFNSEDDYNLAGYKFEKVIGKGSSAEVVQMSKDGISYAVKIIDLSLNFKANFYQNDLPVREPTEEVAILKRFDHVHVVKFVDFIDDTDNDKLFIVMELLSGGTIMECKTLEEKREAFTEALSAVQYIHFQRIAHQDIKPGNILRDEEGSIKLVDFGSAIFISEGIKKVSSGLTGTTAFSPPEKFTEESYDPFLGDIWSLGATLYNMLFGKPPFNGESVFQRQQSIINDEPEFPDDADFDAVELIKLMLKKNPEHRINLGHIWDHPFLGQIPSTSSMRSLLDSSSRIFESLKMSDTMNSMTRISRGSLRSSLKGSLQKAIQKHASKLNKKKQKKSMKIASKHHNDLIKKGQIKKKEKEKIPININDYDYDYESPRESNATETNLVDINTSSEASLNDQSSSTLISSIQKVEPRPNNIKKKDSKNNIDEIRKNNLDSTDGINEIINMKKQKEWKNNINKNQTENQSKLDEIRKNNLDSTNGINEVINIKKQKDANDTKIKTQKHSKNQEIKSESPRKLLQDVPQIKKSDNNIRKQKGEVINNNDDDDDINDVDAVIVTTNDENENENKNHKQSSSRKPKVEPKSQRQTFSKQSKRKGTNKVAAKK